MQDVYFAAFYFSSDVDTDEIETSVAEETIEFLLNVEEIVIEDE